MCLSSSISQFLNDNFDYDEVTALEQLSAYGLKSLMFDVAKVNIICQAIMQKNDKILQFSKYVASLHHSCAGNLCKIILTCYVFGKKFTWLSFSVDHNRCLLVGDSIQPLLPSYSLQECTSAFFFSLLSSVVHVKFAYCHLRTQCTKLSSIYNQVIQKVLIEVMLNNPNKNFLFDRQEA